MLAAIKGGGEIYQNLPYPTGLLDYLLFSGKGTSRKQKDSIIKAHFSSKTYLRNVAQTLEDSPNLEKVLKEALNRIALKGKKHD